jgi:thymidylate kinase
MPEDDGGGGAAARDGFGGERYETREFQERVRDAYCAVVRPGVFLTLDASRSIDDLHAQVQCVGVWVCVEGLVHF